VSRLEDRAEAVVFAHEAERAPLQPRTREERSLEQVAALAAGALCRQTCPSPMLSSKLAAQALHFCAEEHAMRSGEQPGFTTPKRRSSRGAVAFFLGAAAAACAVWLARPTETSLVSTPPAKMRAAALSAGTAQRAMWLRGPSDLSGDVSGDVVWRQQEQDGWLTFRDLPALAPEKTFQLWIVDATREGAPVDGGVFAVDPASEESVVTIRAGLPIGRPAAFVVTVEDRGGVVVSKQEHVVATATL